MDILNSVNSPEDIKKLDYEKLSALSSEIRAFLIENVAKTGGHLASNLGAVELTLALHRVYDTQKDRLVFDVGHQCYVHKILTGRKDKFSGLRAFGGISGFPKPGESDHDAFIAGHASNSIAVALGMARARTLKKEDYSVVALIGDGALTGGLAYEGLCNAGASGEPIVIVLNDNGMSIDSNVGSVSEFLADMRVRPGYFNFKRRYHSIIKRCPRLYNFNHRLKERLKKRLLPNNIFSNLGFEYFGPVDGHNIAQLEAVLQWAKELNAPAVVHVITQKGRGYSYAENDPESYHGVGCFNTNCGISNNGHKCFSGKMGEALDQFAEKDESITAISAAMTAGTGLTGFSHKYPDRFFDVGIAEGHAVAMAAGMAKQGLRPVVAIYSTFLQRAYDMLIHDVSLQGLHVVFAVDRAGIVGNDGETHQGTFDVSYLCSVPNMAVLCPASYAELHDMLKLALYRINGPVAIRYPRGAEGEYKESSGEAFYTCLRSGNNITIVTHGTTINNVLAAAEILSEEGIEAEVIKLNIINPLQPEGVFGSLEKTGHLLTVEEVCTHGSIGERLLTEASRRGLAPFAVNSLDLGTGILTQGSVSELTVSCGLDAEGIARSARELISAGSEERV